MTVMEEIDETTSLTELVLSAQEGDRLAMDELFQRYERAVYAIAYRRLNNDAEAQELCQEVFVQALQKIHQLREPAAFGGWLRSITTRMAINRAIRAAPEIDAENDLLEATCVESETPLTMALAGERQSQVRAGLRRLRKLDRATLLAFYVDGQSLLEMSDKFNSPLGTIKRRLHVARKRLAKELEEFACA
ncbi:MAG TPA: sigma-70 family RNA polymerase sigma factor [Pirellulales bacterium]|jgi:RNA polymerase sigma-70 factor (ECF subfamily)|nr:sigma-70 family RNA polymerase sigma factor [Pirellulales bacterium]